MMKYSPAIIDKKATYRERLMDNGLSTLSYEEGSKVAIYSRVSSEMQIEGYSMDAQEGRCRESRKQKGGKFTKCILTQVILLKILIDQLSSKCCRMRLMESFKLY